MTAVAVLVAAAGVVTPAVLRGGVEPPVVGEVDRPVTADDPRLAEIAEEVLVGRVEVIDGRRHYSLVAWTTEEGRVCVGVWRVACGPPPTPERPLGTVHTDVPVGDEMAPELHGCVYGVTSRGASTVEVVFADGSAYAGEPAVGEGAFEDIGVYAICWTGDRDVREVRALDADGSVVDVVVVRTR